MLNFYLRRERGASIIWDFVVRTPEMFKTSELLSFVFEDERTKILQNVSYYSNSDTPYYVTSAVRRKCDCFESF